MKHQHQISTDLPSSSAPPPPWIELPRDLTANILSCLSVQDRLNFAQLVCKTWWSVCMDPSMWRVIDMNLGLRDTRDLKGLPYDVGAMYLHALKRSQGLLEETKIEFFCTNELLYQISIRSNQLRCLRLYGFSRLSKLRRPSPACPELANSEFAYSARSSGKSLSKLVKKLPGLKELHFFYIPLICGRHIAAIGYSCPKLESFTCNNREFTHIQFAADEHARAVAESMPNLRQLCLFGNSMTNNGLEAILDGCPRLESLDIRQCFNVFLEGDLGKRCSMQIKNLRRPDDSNADM